MPMPMPTLLDASQPMHDTDLLRQLRGRMLSDQLEVLCVIGAHRFDELPLINKIFPALRHIYLFEPLPGPLAALNALALRDARLRVFPVAVSDSEGTASFFVTSNEGESSSLLAFGSHTDLFPEVKVERTVEVPTRRLESVLAEHGLETPDLLLIDVQGAEYQMLRSLPSGLLDKVRLIYTEVSTERVYETAGLLPDIEKVLAPRFVNLGYAPLRAGVPMHGNAVFAASEDVPAALACTLIGRPRSACRGWRQRGRQAR